jgi:hypothetical protein
MFGTNSGIDSGIVTGRRFYYCIKFRACQLILIFYLLSGLIYLSLPNVACRIRTTILRGESYNQGNAI